MAARAVGDEVEFLRARGIGHSFERGASGIGDRARRQAVDRVSVVGRPLLELGRENAATQSAAPADEAVDDRRIGLKAHPLVEAIDEDRGDARALVRLAGFLFDDRGQRDHFVWGTQRQVGIALRPDAIEQLRAIHKLGHQARQLLDSIDFRHEDLRSDFRDSANEVRRGAPSGKSDGRGTAR